MVQYLSPSRNTPSARFARALLSTASARVALLALLQLLVGLTLLGIFEGYKTRFFNGSMDGSEDLSPAERQQLAAERSFFFKTPLDVLFWFSALCSICALFGLAGITAQGKHLLKIFFGYNLVQSVLSLFLFVDTVSDQQIKLVGSAAGVAGFEKAAAAFLFLNTILSLLLSYFTSLSLQEMKQRARESRYQEMSLGVSDTLQFEEEA